MDLTQENSFQIKNKIYCLGSPVVTAETLDQLVYALTTTGDTQRPIIIINPQANTIPNFNELLENFISNAVTSATQEVKTSYILQEATDEEIRNLAEQQHAFNSTLSIAYLVRMYTVIRQQSNLKHAIDLLKAESEQLWREHCAHPESDSGSSRYAEINYQELPKLQAELKRVTEELSFISKEIPTSPDTLEMPESVDKVEEISENLSENSSDLLKVDTVQEYSNQPVSEVSDNVSEICIKWLDSKRVVMPLHAAKELANQQGYQAIKAQQAAADKAYTPVPIEYLLMLGIPVYPDGIPIVFTKSGEFMRIGSSAVSPLNMKYWYPKPSFE